MTLAVLGGEPAFDALPFARPAVPPIDRVVARMEPSYSRGMLTNGPVVRELEDAVAARLGVRHAVAVSCCTDGLLLVLRALDVRGPVVLPSFTFSASAHAVAWNGLTPAFCECEPASFQVDVADAAARLEAEGGGALMGTHVFGAPCDVDAMEKLAADAGVPLVMDAAHGLGATYGDRAVGGCGVAEVFSLSPTKVVVAGEGGIVSTNDDGVAEAVRIGRDYGNPGDYDTRFVGLNARMSELHAAVAVESLLGLDEQLGRRHEIAARYRDGLAAVEGIAPQEIRAEDRSTYKDFTVAVDEARFGLSRDQLVDALRADGIDTRNYFSPPVHRQQSYASLPLPDLPVTDDVAGRVVSLPIYTALADRDIDRIVEVIAAARDRAGEVRAALEHAPRAVLER